MVADQIRGKATAAWSGRSVGHVTFTDPKSAASTTEESARAQGINVGDRHLPDGIDHPRWIHGPGNAGFFKLVVDADTRTVVGGTVDAGEIPGPSQWHARSY